MRLEARDEEVEFLKLAGVEVGALGRTCRRGCRHCKPTSVHVMKAHAIDAELGQPRGDSIRLVRGHERRIAGEVDAQKADALAVGDEMAVGVHRDAVGPMGGVTWPRNPSRHRAAHHPTAERKEPPARPYPSASYLCCFRYSPRW